MKKLNQTGFTLVETVITLSVVALVLGVITSFALTSLNQSTTQAARADLLGQSQIALDKMINDIRLSSGADQNNRWPDPNNGGNSLNWQSNATTLVLATAAMNSSDTIIFADPAMYISEKNNVVYFVRDGKLYKRVLASTVANNAAKTTCPPAAATSSCPGDIVMLNNVTEFNLKYFNADNQEVVPSNARSIQVTVKTSVRKFKNNITSDYTTRAVFRND